MLTRCLRPCSFYAQACCRSDSEKIRFLVLVFLHPSYSSMVTARVRNKPAASKVMRRSFAKSGNDDLVVVSHTTESSATAVAKKPSSKAVGVGEIEEEEDAEDMGDKGHEDSGRKAKATARRRGLCFCDACGHRKDLDKFDSRHLYTAIRRGTKRVCLDCEAIGCSPRDCTVYVCEGSSMTMPHKAGHRNFPDSAMKRYKYNRENSTSSVIPFRCRSCSEEHCEDERSRKRQKKATAAGPEPGPAGQEPRPAILLQ